MVTISAPPLERGRPHSAASKHWLRRLGVLVLVFTLCTIVLSGCSISFGQAQTITPGQGITVPITVIKQGGATTIEANLTINGRGPYTFIVDTGAETSAIDSSLTVDLGLKRSGPPHQVGGVGGTTEAIPVKIDSWSLDTLALPSTSIDSVSLAEGLNGNEEGLLGSDILSQFGTVTINYTNMQLTVYKQIA